MENVNIVMTRIDERLLHGQGQVWTRYLGVNTVIIVNDAVSTDKIQQALMGSVVAQGIALRFFSVQKTIDIISKASPKQKIFMIIKTPEDALKLVAGGVPIKEINIGNIHKTEGKKMVTRSIYIGEDDKKALKEMIEKYNIKFNTQTTPGGDDGTLKIDITKYL